MNRLSTSYSRQPVDLAPPPRSPQGPSTYLNRAHVGILRRVLILIEAILCELPFLQIDAQLHEQYHHRLQRGDGTVSRPFGGDMLMECGESSLRLAHTDELLSSLSFQSVEPDLHSHTEPLTLSTFSGLVCGGGGMMTTTIPTAAEGLLTTKQQR